MQLKKSLKKKSLRKNTLKKSLRKRKSIKKKSIKKKSFKKRKSLRNIKRKLYDGTDPPVVAKVDDVLFDNMKDLIADYADTTIKLSEVPMMFSKKIKLDIYNKLHIDKPIKSKIKNINNFKIFFSFVKTVIIDQEVEYYKYSDSDSTPIEYEFSIDTLCEFLKNLPELEEIIYIRSIQQKDLKNSLTNIINIFNNSFDKHNSKKIKKLTFLPKINPSPYPFDEHNYFDSLKQIISKFVNLKYLETNCKCVSEDFPDTLPIETLVLHVDTDYKQDIIINKFNDLKKIIIIDDATNKDDPFRVEEEKFDINKLLTRINTFGDKFHRVIDLKLINFEDEKIDETEFKYVKLIK